MEAFGDVSGHFRGLLGGGCDVVVVGVAVGDGILAGRCPKKTVRNVKDIPEAKWYDLTELQKRRFIDRVADQEALKFGYAKFTRDSLNTIKNHYLLHQNVDFPPAWDLALTGYTYGEVLFEHNAQDESVAVFTLDRVASKPQGKAICQHVQTFVPNINPFLEGSRQSPGIQAADCFAGAVAEDHKYGTSWLDAIDDSRITDCGSAALVQLENDLDEAGI